MLNEQLFKIVKTSMLQDRNLENGTIIEQKITEKFIQLVVKDHGDTVQLKRGTKDCLETYWNVTVKNNWTWKRLIQLHGITFEDFKTEIDKIVNEGDGDIDLDRCVFQALDIVKSGKITAGLDKDNDWDNYRDEENDNDSKEDSEGSANVVEDEEKAIATSENAMTDEELQAMISDEEIEDLEDKKKKILLFISKNTHYEFRPTLLQKLVDIKSKECTQLIIQLIFERKIRVTKKGKDRIYGATLEYQAESDEKTEKNDKKDKKIQDITIGSTVS